MKNNWRRQSIALLFPILILISVPASLSGCECSTAINVVIENQTDQVLTISYYEDTKGMGDLEPGQQITVNASGISGEFPIVARNMEGEIVFSETYTFNPEKNTIFKR